MDNAKKALIANSPAGLAQSVERKTLNLKAAGSTPAFGYSYKPNLRFLFCQSFFFLLFFFFGSTAMLKLKMRGFQAHDQYLMRM